MAKNETLILQIRYRLKFQAKSTQTCDNLCSYLSRFLICIKLCLSSISLPVRAQRIEHIIAINSQQRFSFFSVLQPVIGVPVSVLSRHIKS